MSIHEDEKGCQIRFRFIRDGEVADVSAALIKELWAKPYGGSWTSYTCSFVTDGTDGLVGHTFTAAEMAAAGVWYTQAFVETSGWSKWSDVESFLVKQNKP